MTKPKSTVKRNTAFDRLSPAKKRVAIAKDVLKQLATKKYVVSPGDYFVLASEELMEDEDPSSHYYPCAIKEDRLQNELCDEIDRPGASCKVCAIGSVFASAVRLADKLKVSDLFETGDRFDNQGVESSFDDFAEYLQQFFDEGQLRLMEAYFEGDPRIGYDVGETEVECNIFGLHKERAASKDQHLKPETRMRKIMENIIKNKGEFVI